MPGKKPAKKTTKKRKPKAVKPTITIRCQGAGVAELDNLHEFQGALKDLSKVNLAKLKNEILTMGFKAPFATWVDPDGVRHILDGHQRRRVLIHMRDEEGYEIPPLPYNVTEADSWREAKLTVLALTSSYGNMTASGLDEFMIEAGIELEEIGDRFEFGKELRDDMEKFLERKKFAGKNSAWGWKEKQPSTKPLTDEEEAMEFWDWMKTFEVVYSMYSGGKDSMSLIASLLDNGIDKKKIVMVNLRTPLSHPGMQESSKAFAKTVGVRYLQLGEEMEWEDYVKQFEKSGFPTRYLPWCTTTWKAAPMRRYFRDEKIDQEKSVICLGWRREEGPRRAKVSERNINSYGSRMAYPILSLKEEEVYQIIKDRGWKLHYVYDRSEECGWADRLGCYCCYALGREQWVLMREKRPDLFIRSLEVLALGCASPNISDQVLRDKLRALFGLDTVYQARKRMGIPMDLGKTVDGKTSSKWGGPAHDPDKEPVFADADIMEEDFGEAQLFHSKKDG